MFCGLSVEIIKVWIYYIAFMSETMQPAIRFMLL